MIYFNTLYYVHSDAGKQAFLPSANPLEEDTNDSRMKRFDQILNDECTTLTDSPQKKRIHHSLASGTVQSPLNSSGESSTKTTNEKSDIKRSPSAKSTKKTTSHSSVPTKRKAENSLRNGPKSAARRSVEVGGLDTSESEDDESGLIVCAMMRNGQNDDELSHIAVLGKNGQCVFKRFDRDFFESLKQSFHLRLKGGPKCNFKKPMLHLPEPQNEMYAKNKNYYLVTDKLTDLTEVREWKKRFSSFLGKSVSYKSVKEEIDEDLLIRYVPEISDSPDC